MSEDRCEATHVYQGRTLRCWWKPHADDDHRAFVRGVGWIVWGPVEVQRARAARGE